MCMQTRLGIFYNSNITCIETSKIQQKCITLTIIMCAVVDIERSEECVQNVCYIRRCITFLIIVNTHFLGYKRLSRIIFKRFSLGIHSSWHFRVIFWNVIKKNYQKIKNIFFFLKSWNNKASDLTLTPNIEPNTILKWYNFQKHLTTIRLDIFKFGTFLFLCRYVLILILGRKKRLTNRTFLVKSFSDWKITLVNTLKMSFINSPNIFLKQ